MQSTNHILLIKPANFGFNVETSDSNAFQNKLSLSAQEVKASVGAEFELFEKTLRDNGVDVIVKEDTPVPIKPDAIFPNNWVSFHEDGTVVLYPMCAPNRRLERRPDLIEELKKDFVVSKVIDFSGYEGQNVFLEGTGSIIFDRKHKVAYACLSPRTDKKLFEEVCVILGYEPNSFYAHDEHGKEVYHTNVMMCIADGLAVICAESITDEEERAEVLQKLHSTGHTVVEINFGQMNKFAGNMLSVKNGGGENLLVLSATAFDSLTHAQKKTIENITRLVPQSIPVIEGIGGGSARCMMAEVFLPLKV